MQTTCARKQSEKSQDSYLTATLADVRIHKQADKINHGACVGRHNRNKSIIGKFCNAWSHHVQVSCMN